MTNFINLKAMNYLGIASFLSLTFAVMFIGVSDVSTIGFVLCLATIIGLNISGLKRNVPQRRETSWYLIAILVFSAVVALNILFERAALSSSELGLRFLLSFYFMSTLAAFARKQEYNFVDGVVMVAAAHAFILTLTAISQVYFSGADPNLVRAHGNTNAIPFSEMMTTAFGIVGIWMFCKARATQSNMHAIYLLIWLVTMIFAVSLTGTRGSIIAIYPLLIGLIVFSIRDRGVYLLKVSLFLALVVLFWKTSTDPRTAEGIHEFSQTIEGVENAGSVGMRLAMWGYAWEAIKLKPILGHGLIPLRDIAEFSTAHPLYRFGHAHNQFIDAWMKLGLAGLLTFTFIICLPFYSGIRMLLTTGADISALICIWISGSFIVFGLTQAFLQHSNSSICFSLFITASMFLNNGNAGSASETPD